MSEMVSFRVTKDERQAVQNAAAKAGESVSAYVRRVLLRSASTPVATWLTFPSRTAVVGPQMRFDANTCSFVQDGFRYTPASQHLFVVPPRVCPYSPINGG